MAYGYEFLDLKIEPEMRVVMQNNKRLEMPELSFQLLLTLVKAAPMPVSFEELAKEVWGVDAVTEETISQRVSLLRRVLNDDIKVPVYIRTIRGKGYCINAKVTKTQKLKAISSKYPYSTLKVGGTVLLLLALGFAVLSPYSKIFFGLHESGNIEKHQRSQTQLSIDRATALLQVQQAVETDRAIQIIDLALLKDKHNYTLKTSLSFALSTRVTKFIAHQYDINRAEGYAREVLEEKPNYATAWHALGYALDAQGKISEAISAYKNAFALNPADTNAISSVAYLLGIQGNLYEALQLEALGRQNGGSGRYVEIQIANILELLSYPEAQYWYDRAEELNPGQVVIMAELAERALVTENYDRAMALVTKGVINEQNAPRLIYIRGRGLYLQGETKSARETLSNGDTEAQLYLAAINANQGGFSSKKALIKQAQKDFNSGNTWPSYRIQLAELHAAMGNEQPALQLLSQAVDLGWRNVAYIESSPFFKKILQKKEWLETKSRIQNEVTGQRTLVKTDTNLAFLFNPQP